MNVNETSNWIAFAGLLALMFVQSSTFAFFLGRLFQQVGALRKDVDAAKASDGDDGKANSTFREAFAEFRGEIRAQITHLDGRVADLAVALSAIPAPAYQPRARPKGGQG